MNASHTAIVRTKFFADIGALTAILLCEFVLLVLLLLALILICTSLAFRFWTPTFHLTFAALSFILVTWANADLCVMKRTRHVLSTAIVSVFTLAYALTCYELRRSLEF